jgi:hypothetical protein
MAENRRARFFGRVSRLGLAALAASWIAAPLGGSTAYAQVTIELDQLTAAIKGQDVTIHARTSAEVDGCKLYIRKLLELGDFNDLPMEKTGATTFRYVLPLSQEQGEVGRLEYYVAAFKGGQEVAKTDSLVISFIDPPFIGELTAGSTEGLTKEDWKLFIKGRISRPFYKRWWVYALAGAIAIPVTAVLASGGTAVPGPPSTTIAVADAARRDFALDFLCPGRQIPVTLMINQGVSPFDVIYTLKQTGGSSTITLEGIGPLPRGQELVVLPVKTYQTPSGQNTSTQTENFPALNLTPRPQQIFGSALLQFRAIVRDKNTKTSFAGATVGQPLPSGVTSGLTSDSRLISSATTDGAQTGITSGCSGS